MEGTQEPKTVGVSSDALLSDARARLARAHEHLKYISEAAERFEAENADRLKLRIEGMTVTLVGDTPDAPPGLSVRIGEFAYNLRAVLDYSVFALAFLDSGRPQQQTQFVIADSLEKFQSQARGRLKGLAPEHQAMIEQLQPYHGHAELAALRDLTNKDKHRAVQILGVVGGPLRVTIEGPDTPAYLIDAPVVLCFPPENIPVMHLLPALYEKVASVLARFEPSFVRQLPAS